MKKTLIAAAAVAAALQGCAADYPSAHHSEAAPGLDHPVSAGPLNGSYSILDEANHLVFFGTASSAISAKGDTRIQEWADRLEKDSRAEVIIEGHADERGSDTYNYDLGAARASAVRQALIAKGVAPWRIRVISKGEWEPRVIGKGPGVWAENRRAALLVDRN